MNIIFLLIGTSILVALAFLLIFIWSVRSGQYDDSYTPAVRMLFDEPVNQSDTQDVTEKPDRVEART